jgi:hypothetical protein
MSGEMAADSAALIGLAYRYHPRGQLDVEPGYESWPEVRARRRAQEHAQREPGAWTALLAAARSAWPAAQVMDWSRLELDTARHLRLQIESTRPRRHLVAWASILAPVALVYEAEAAPGKSARILTRADAAHPEELERLEALVRQHGWVPMAPEIATIPLPELAVGNLLPGRVTLADALFSDHRW